VSLQLSISIVVYESRADELRAALTGVMKSRLTTECYVVDNSATDGLRQTVQECGAEYLFVGSNIGFAAGHNRIIRIVGSRSSYHLIMNPDALCRNGVLEELYDFMEANSRIGWVMPRVEYPDGSEQRLCRRIASPLDLILRRFVPAKWTRFSRRLQRYECRDVDLSHIRYVPCLSGCFMFLRTAALQAIGGFDEGFFLYMEDFDLARRMTEQWDTVFYPHTSIRHRHDRGSYHNWRLLAIHLCSAIKYFAKWGWIVDTGRIRLNNRLMEDRVYTFRWSPSMYVPRLRLGKDGIVES
jgi:GT2 family glycosyltransferase